MMNDGKQEQLEKMVAACRGLDADLRYRPESSHFTVLAWEKWDDPQSEDKAHLLQRQIQQMSAQYPNLVCYCFDPFSTLVYAV